MMSRFTVLLYFFISTVAAENAALTTTSASIPTHQCKNQTKEILYTMNDFGNTLTVTPETYAKQCFDNAAFETTSIRINGIESMNYYILFTNTKLDSWQKVFIIDDDQSSLVICEGDDKGAQFCPPVIYLNKNFLLQLPSGNEHDVQVVIVATSAIPYSYYAYSQLPVWATLATVIFTFIFVFLMTLLCCCCLRTLCCGRHRERTVPSRHAGCRRNLPNGPPVYSANPVVFDLPPIYVVREEAPVPPKTPQFNQLDF